MSELKQNCIEAIFRTAIFSELKDNCIQIASCLSAFNSSPSSPYEFPFGFILHLFIHIIKLLESKFSFGFVLQVNSILSTLRC
jgi:hypothetical protein